MSIDRRTFLKIGGIGIFGVTFAPIISGCEEHIVTILDEAETAPFVTPQNRFFVQNGGQGSIEGWALPEIVQADWKLTIEQESFTPPFLQELGAIGFQDLIDAKDQEITILKTMQCVLESPVKQTLVGDIGTAYWTGVPLRLFLDRVGLDLTSFKRLRLYADDGFTNNVPVERILSAETEGLVQPLLVYRMNGEPLSRDHGFPVRLIIQEGFGYKNIKWITKVRASFNDDTFGTYQDEGYVDDGVMRVNSRAIALPDGSSLPTGPTEISGFAVSGYAPISQVEISIDGGAFQPATIIPLDEIQQEEALPPTILQLMQDHYPFKAVWVKWRFEWDTPAGSHTIDVRASDTAGNIQPADDDNRTDGQTGVTRYTVTAA